ncbi:MAG: 30S ribosome-binding factor RbfA [Alphaproteobacteria bacterium]|nr:30S ribosome-binding factor RbfA [Alphaproteobacteria bacterium]MBO7641913.1 30S ribosome-binding factor RbfA [Alphaproteobacteria bacterium]
MNKNNGSRSDKVASEIKKVVSEYLIRGGLESSEGVNPLMIVVTDVVVSSCLRHAKIFVSSISDDLNSDVCRDYLERHSSQIRKTIGSSIKLKFVPEVRFLTDTSREKAQRIEDILNAPSFKLR